MKISIGIGHADGTDAHGNGTSERAICADVARALRLRLAGGGYEADIIDFPQESNRRDLVLTAKAVNAGGYGLHISLHCDSSRDGNARGAHVCYVSTGGKRLAKCIARRLCVLMPGRAEQVVRRTKLYILNKTDCVCVVVECGFVSSPDDVRKMKSRVSEIAACIAEGVAVYLGRGGV